MMRWMGTALLVAAVCLPAAAQEETPNLSREVCADCHEEAETFAAGAHGRAMAARDPALLAASCNACHGPADAHVEEPLAENIVRLPGPEACTSCHPGGAAHLALATPGHRRHAVACLDCHASGHQNPPAEPLLAAAPATLCGGCHREQANAGHRPFAHRDGGEPFACTRCHSVHGQERVGRLALLGGAGGACLDCHSEKAGPFVFSHPPHQVNGCVACHQPHGSTNPRLLTRRNVLNLCLECHAGIPALHNLAQARFRACQSCHAAVHGSNRDPRLFDE